MSISPIDGLGGLVAESVRAARSDERRGKVHKTGEVMAHSISLQKEDGIAI